ANDVVSGGRLVRASAFPAAYPDGLTIGLGSADGRSAFSAEGFFNTDPFEIINSPVDPNGHVDDIAINGAFNFGSLAPGQSASGAMLMTFGRSVAAADALYAARAVSTQAADRDFYRLTADARAMLEIDTATPADGTEALTITAADSPPATKRCEAGSERVTIASVCPLPQRRMCATASSRESTTPTARSSERYSAAQSSSVAGTTPSS